MLAFGAMPGRCCFLRVTRRMCIAGAEGALRLAGGRDGPAGENVSGMVEIFHAGAWGTLCRLAPLSRDMEYDVYGRIVFAQSFSEVLPC